MECFERALELTSVNCGFCRKRIVGFARKKQNKVHDLASLSSRSPGIHWLICSVSYDSGR